MFTTFIVPDKYDLDVLYRILAQIMTKIPKDLKDRITGKQKLQIFQLGAKFINIEPKLLEKFIAFDPSINTPISMELDQNDYKALNEKYLRELYNFQKKQPYLNSNSLEYGSLASKISQTMPTMKPSNNLNMFRLVSQDNTLFRIVDVRCRRRHP